MYVYIYLYIFGFGFWRVLEKLFRILRGKWMNVREENPPEEKGPLRLAGLERQKEGGGRTGAVE